MATVSTTIPAVKAALVQGLSAMSELAGVQVSYGPPGEYEREVIVVGNARGRQEADSTGRSRKERYDLRVTVNVLKRDTPQGATERAVAIAAQVETYVRDNPEFSCIVLQATIGDYELHERHHSDGAESEVRMDVSILAKI